MLLKGFSILSSGGHFVHWRGTILSILVENIYVKTYEVCTDGLGGDIVFFLKKKFTDDAQCMAPTGN